MEPHQSEETSPRQVIPGGVKLNLEIRKLGNPRVKLIGGCLGQPGPANAIIIQHPHYGRATSIQRGLPPGGLCPKGSSSTTKTKGSKLVEGYLGVPGPA